MRVLGILSKVGPIHTTKRYSLLTIPEGIFRIPPKNVQCIRNGL